MKLGVFTALYQDRPFEWVLDHLAGMGLQSVELGTGNWPGDAHCRPSELLGDPEKARALRAAVESRGLFIGALSCHGNPLHPDRDLAARHDQVFRDTVRLASQLEIPVVNLFSGCPGDCDESKYPNWVTCAWPPDFEAVLKWQWEAKAIPYWQEAGAFAAEHGVKLAFEMHPGFVVYNPATLLRLREAVGPVIGANYDPSHLFWQGIDPVASLRALEGAIHHVHAKDTYLDAANTAVNGVLDPTPYGDVAHRSWTFRTVGYGHDQFCWRTLVSTLRLVGYDYVLSIEHEDPLLSVEEGLRRAVDFLKDVLLTEAPSGMWWA
jgi:sugar phosphate isomerase/epimerase